VTDLELLKKAAAASGVVELANEQTPNVAALRIFGGYWDPLRNDGDAFVLAVKLRLAIFISTEGVRVEGVVDTELVALAWEGSYGVDDLRLAAATRRAIVNAAVEIAVKKAAILG